MTEESYVKLLAEYELAKGKTTTKTSREYYLVRQYNLITVGDDVKLVPKIKRGGCC